MISVVVSKTRVEDTERSEEERIRAALKKQRARNMNEQLDLNKRKLEHLNEKASEMFQQVEEIQQLIFTKCQEIDDKIFEAEINFKQELDTAIDKNKQMRKQLHQNLKQNLVKGAG